MPTNLTRTVQYMIEQNIRHETNKCYNSANNHYKKFCKEFGFEMYPVTELKLSYYLAWGVHKIKAKSVNNYINGIKYNAKICGFPIETDTMPMYKMCKRALTTVFDGNTKKERKPYLWEHYIEDFTKFGIENYDDLVCFTALSVAILTMMRPAEYLARKQDVAFHKRDNASARTLYINNLRIVLTETGKLDYCVVKCRLVKTDKGLNDVEIVWPRGQWPLSPADLVLKMFVEREKLAKTNEKLRVKSQEFLFVTSDGKVLTYRRMQNFFNKLIKARGWDIKLYSLYAPKDCSTTSYARRGLTKEQLQMYGRWLGNSYLEYTKLSHKDVADNLYRFTSQPIVDPNVVYLYDPVVGYQVKR